MDEGGGAPALRTDDGQQLFSRVRLRQQVETEHQSKAEEACVCVRVCQRTLDW